MTLFDDLAGASSEPHTFTVGELGGWLREIVQARLPDEVWVQGEIRNLSRSRAGHVYFDLVEPASTPGQSPTALLSVVLFNSTREAVNRQLTRAGGAVRVTDGVHVRMRAVVDFYPPQGRLQLRMTGIDPTYTLGLLASERDLLVRTLAHEGLLGANRSVSFPRLPLRIGLVTRAGSAACADFCQELARTGTAFEVVLVDTPVQGEHAAWSVAASIRTAERHGVDVIAVVRGGGARTDLVAFDSELVARAIATRRVPVLTGIGHEVDTTVADDVAHLALKTPTACAAHLAEAARLFAAELEACWNHIARQAGQLVAVHDTHLRDTAHAAVRATTDSLRLAESRTANTALVVRHHGERSLDRQRSKLNRASSRSAGAARAHVAAERTRLEALVARVGRSAPRGLAAAGRDLGDTAERIRLLDPATNLARGWSIARGADGRVLRSVVEVEPGAPVALTVADGTIHTVVEHISTPPPSLEEA